MDSVNNPLHVLVIGASAGTGLLCVKSALERGHIVTAFARSPEKISLEHPNLRKVKGDFHDADSVNAAMAGQNAVIVTASSKSIKGFKENPTFFSSGTQNTIDAMKKNGATRIVILSAIGVGDSKVLMPWILQKIMIEGILKYAIADHTRQEALVAQSGLEWVVARPPRLTNGPARGKFKATDKVEKIPITLSRADLANFLVDACTGTTWTNKCVKLGG